MYASREAGIESFAKTYSFNIESVLFNQLTLEQQELWRKEIENAAISGGEMGLELAYDKRYDKELGEDLEEAAEKYAFPEGKDKYGIEEAESNGIYFREEKAKHFKAGAEWQKQKSMQDFLEKACEWLEDTQLENFICRDDGIYFENEKFVEKFKNYIQNEM